MTGIIQSNNHKVLQINGMPDHVHILIGLRPTQSLSDLIKQVKQDSSKWINSKQLVVGKFSWQSGFGAFSYAKSQLPNVINYIKNQETHHASKSLREEYVQLLEEFGVSYNERYILRDVL